MATVIIFVRMLFSCIFSTDRPLSTGGVCTVKKQTLEHAEVSILECGSQSFSLGLSAWRRSGLKICFFHQKVKL